MFDIKRVNVETLLTYFSYQISNFNTDAMFVTSQSSSAS